MSDRINLLRRLSSLDRSPEFDGVTKLICNIDDETQMIVGDDTGYALEFDNPLMTRAVLQAMLGKIRGYQYQPYQAEGAILDPAAEMGDAVSVRGLYGGIFTRSRNFSRLMKANIAAPADEEIDHEYKFETKQERKVKRQIGEVRATLLVQADRITAEVSQREADSAEFRGQLQVQATQIAARVTQTGGNNSSFGWSLLANEFGLYSGSKKVFYVNASGAHVQGEITATSGKIGGFTIGASAIYNNISKFGGTQTTGVYLGTNGIQLGQRFKVDSSGNVTASNLTINGGSIRIGSNFSVDSSGNVKASNMKLTGTLTVGDATITANNLRLGAERCNSGYTGWNGTTTRVSNSGGGWDNAYGWTSNNGSYCVGGAGWGYNFGSMDNAYNMFPINASSFRYKGTQYTPHTLSFYDYYENLRSITYLGPASE